MLNKPYIFIMLFRTLIVCALLFPAHTASSGQSEILVGKFSDASLADWEEKSFRGNTQYQLKTINNQSSLQAVSKDAASGLIKEQKINIKQYPYLNWRWRIEDRLPVSDEQTKEGDDYSARIYVIKDGGLFFWKTKAINYVWSRASRKGIAWNNAYAGESAKMIAIRSGKDSTRTWYTEKRNIYEDFKRYFGEAIDQIDAIAIMTDSDNTHAQTTAWYGDVYFTAE
jgi:hypothetical protein